MLSASLGRPLLTLDEAFNKWRYEMNLPRENFFNVSGIDPNHGAEIVFAWCRDPELDHCALLGSGNVVGSNSVRPPGVVAGQFSVTFLLPPGCREDEVFVTDDKNGKEHLPGVTLTACSGVSGLRSNAITS